MGVLRNAKWEAFAQALSKGQPVLSSYVLVGYRENAPNATRLAKNDKIQTRIDELIARKDESLIRAETRAISAAAVDKKWVLQRLVYEAEKGEQSSARCKALELVGKEMGMFIQRQEIGTPGSFETLDTTQAILDAVRQQLGDEAYNAMRALVDKKTNAPKVIEHRENESEQDSEIIDAEPIRGFD